MAGRPRIIRSIQSYINHIDAHTFSGPMKTGTSPSIGVTRNFGIIISLNVIKKQVQ